MYIATRVSIFFPIFIALLAIPASTTADQLILGIHVHDPAHISETANIGYTAIRLWDSGTSWMDLSPRRGQYSLERLNMVLRASERSRLKTILVLGSTPRWASSRPNEKCAYSLGCAAEPLAIQDWRDYVKEIATTYRGRIQCYEPWNEVSFPFDSTFSELNGGGDPGEFFSGSVESMVELAKVAYETIKSIDPQACVLSPSFHSSGNWREKFDRYLAAGGGRYFDVVSQHFYVPEEPEQAVRLIQMVRNVMAKYGLQDVPIWNTEVGFPFLDQVNKWPSLTIEEFVYGFILKTYLLNASEGVSRIYWYAADNGVMGFFDPSTKRDYGSAAAREAVKMLDGAQGVKCGVAANVWKCRLTRGHHLYTILWLGGRNNQPLSMSFDHDAIRYGRETESIPARTKVSVDTRPVIVYDE